MQAEILKQECLSRHVTICACVCVCGSRGRNHPGLSRSCRASSVITSHQGEWVWVVGVGSGPGRGGLRCDLRLPAGEGRDAEKGRMPCCLRSGKSEIALPEYSEGGWARPVVVRVMDITASNCSMRDWTGLGGMRRRVELGDKHRQVVWAWILRALLQCSAARRAVSVATGYEYECALPRKSTTTTRCWLVPDAEAKYGPMAVVGLRVAHPKKGSKCQPSPAARGDSQSVCGAGWPGGSRPKKLLGIMVEAKLERSKLRAETAGKKSD